MWLVAATVFQTLGKPVTGILLWHACAAFPEAPEHAQIDPWTALLAQPCSGKQVREYNIFCKLSITRNDRGSTGTTR